MRRVHLLLPLFFCLEKLQLSQMCVCNVSGANNYRGKSFAQTQEIRRNGISLKSKKVI